MKTDNQRILVCVSSSPSCHRLIHTASQMAASMHASWVAVFVMEKYDKEKKSVNWQHGMDNLIYAKELGAEIQFVSGYDIAYHLSMAAKKWDATQLVLGRRVGRKNLSIRTCCLVSRLRCFLKDTEIITIPNPVSDYEEESDTKLSLSWKDMGISLGIMAVTTLLCWWFNRLGFTDATLITVYILAVLIISFFTNGYLCGMISSLLSVMVFNFLFTVPFFSLKSYGTGYPVTLVVMFFAAFLTSYLTVQVRRQAQQHAQNAYRTEMLLGANRKLQRAANEKEIMEAAAVQISKLLMRSVILYPVRSNQLAEPILIPVGETSDYLAQNAAQPEEREVAKWVIQNNIQAGATTGIYDDAGFWYLAVRMNEGDNICAVAGIRMNKREWVDVFDKNLLLAMLGECAVAVEKERLNRAGEEYAIQIKQEQMRSNLLRSISHDLRTPLTAISGNANMLKDGTVMTEKDKEQIYTDIYEDSVWLIDLVENLLSITRIDGGHLHIHLQPQDMSDILDEAVAHMQSRMKKHHIQIIKPEKLVMVSADSALLVQLLDNLIENAFKYGAEDGTVDITVKMEHKKMILLVADNGPGIPDAEKEKIFEMFYTTRTHKSSDDRRGLGIGLALCKIIVQEHNGTIRVYDREPHGAVFEVIMPALE